MELDVYDFKGPGVALAMYNVDSVCLLSLGCNTLENNIVLQVASTSFFLVVLTFGFPVYSSFC